MSDSVTTCNLRIGVARDNPFYFIHARIALTAAYEVLFCLHCIRDAEDYPDDYDGTGECAL